jgi:sterol 3beta-glucosyltransferase
MRVVIISVGSRGDVQPFVALGVGLRQAGHDVCIATRSRFELFVGEHGLDFAPVERPPRPSRQQNDKYALTGSGRNTIKYLYYQLKRMLGSIERSLIDSWHACHGADAVIYAPNVPAGTHIAENLGVPCYAACVFPITRTRAFPMLLTPARPHLGGAYNKLTYALVEQIGWHALRGTINRWRRETLKLPAVSLRGSSLHPFSDPYVGQQGRQLPWLYGFSPSVVPKPSDWPEQVHVTGYWFLDTPTEWQPPTDLTNFLRAGPPPIYIGFGSVKSQDTTATIDIVLQAFKQTGQRGILGIDRREVEPSKLPSEVFVTESIPFDWLFPQVGAVVHHGGSGTVGAGLRAGIPTITVPFFGEQSFWGDRVAELGVGPRPIMRKQLTAERLAGAISAATSDMGIRTRAAELGARICAEDGVGVAVKIFHSYL